MSVTPRLAVAPKPAISGKPKPRSKAAIIQAATCGKGEHDYRVVAKPNARIVKRRCVRCHEVEK